MKRIYLDYASLTPIDKRVMKEIKKYSSKDYSNLSSLYLSGVKAKNAVLNAKKRIANIIHAHPDEIIFTSGGTESNNLVLENFTGEQIIISAIEHSSIIKNAKAKANSKTDAKITRISVDADGIVDLEELKKAITPETAIVSIMLVNNEIGTIQPIREIAKIVRNTAKKFNTKILFHTDACQAMYLPLHVEKMCVDLITLDGNKIHGPRGVGVLYVKRGSVEMSRAGTENLPGIAGIALALEIADKMREKEYARIEELKNYFIEGLQKINPAIKINGKINTTANDSTEKTSPHILNISIPNIDNEFFVLQLDAKGIECSTKSACLKDEDESYVLKAIGADSKTSVRFSFGRATTKGDIRKTLKVIANIL